MRYIGSKDNLLPFLTQAVAAQEVRQGVFVDLFAGTTAVGRHFKRRGFRVVSNDLMTYSFAFGKAYIESSAPPSFTGLASQLPPSPDALFAEDLTPLRTVLAFLNGLPPEPGFMFGHYCDEGTRHQEHQRMYFSAANAPS